MVEGIQRLLGLALVLMLLMSPSGAAPVLALPEAAPTSAQESVAVRVVASPDESFVHAPGKGKTIRVDSLSNRYYAARYLGARTYLK